MERDFEMFGQEAGNKWVPEFLTVMVYFKLYKISSIKLNSSQPKKLKRYQVP